MTLSGLLMAPAAAEAERVPVVPRKESLAFARYISWRQDSSHFGGPAPAALQREASLLGQAKAGRLLAIRLNDARPIQYVVLEAEGDPTVFRELIGPYLTAKGRAQGVLPTSDMITPSDYKFRYMRTLSIGDGQVCVFRIKPRKNQRALVKGELWIELASGIPVLVTGSITSSHACAIREIHLRREVIKKLNQPVLHATRVTLQYPAGEQAELNIVELPVAIGNNAPTDADDPLHSVSVQPGQAHARLDAAGQLKSVLSERGRLAGSGKR